MKYCARCLYPENAKPTIIFDESGICSGCRVFETKDHGIDWEARERALREIVSTYKNIAAENKNPYDCIIPVSGGKDSHFQVYLAKVVYGMNPLLVCYNHGFNTEIGIRNLRNLAKQFGCDLLRYTHNLDSVRAITKYMLKKIGDVTWHYHTGINTYPIQMAVKYNIPLILWGEHGYSEMTGMFQLQDIPEFTKWCRREHEMRGIDIEELLRSTDEITLKDVVPLIYPDDEDIDRVGVRGIYLGNYVKWDANEQAKLLHERYAFKFMSSRRDRTFSMYHKIDDHANDVHDYLKFLKFGYGRATDLASFEIRSRRMTREEGIEMVRQYDHVRPQTLDVYLDFLGINEAEFEAAVEHQRDLNIWEKDGGSNWQRKDSILSHAGDPNVEEARLPLLPEEDRTTGCNNAGLYYAEGITPMPVDEQHLGGVAGDFTIL